MKPILRFAECRDGVWRVSVAELVAEGAGGSVSCPDGVTCSEPEILLSHSGEILRRYVLEAGQGTESRRVDVLLPAGEISFHVPPRGQAPRMAYASCNGFSDPKLMKGVKRANDRWEHMASLHREDPYHLLLLGGDQVYADQIWEERTAPSLTRWLHMPEEDRITAPFDAEMEAEVEEFYFDLYRKRWAQDAVAAVFSAIPTLMMWDDHDIFDGWGSYDAPMQNSAVYQGIYAAARRYFMAFQLHLAPSVARGVAYLCPNRENLSQYYRIADTGVLILDLRSERTEDQVISPKSWQSVYAALDKILQQGGEDGGLTHLLVMSSIPVVHPDFSLVETILRFAPGRQSLEDDLRDHWRSRAHKAERLRLIHRLFAIQHQHGIRVSILSGDVHVAALGVLEWERTDMASVSVINQLTSSGIVHPSPAAIIAWAYDNLFDRQEVVDRGIKARMTDFPGTSQAFIPGRNWLALEPDSPRQGQRIWANWHVEGEAAPYTKVIHPLRGQEMPLR